MEPQEHFLRHGYAVVRSLFGPRERRAIARAFDRIYARGMGYRASFRRQNVLFRIAPDAALGRVVRMVQWPSYFDPLLDKVRRDPRLLALVSPLIGRDLKQIINQMHWKPPGAAMVEFGYHQDCHFRRPAAAYRALETSYVQTGIALDPHTVESGAMTVYPGSHRLGPVELSQTGRVMDTRRDVATLEALGLDPADMVTLEMAPGDVALWHPCTIHGSGPNHADHDRRLYINGYVTAANCERGVWTFRNGAPCPIGPPVLIHYEDLFARPAPHYVDEPSAPNASRAAA